MPRTARVRAARWSLSFVALLSLGCGYALVGRASNLPESMRKVYVEPLVNTTRRSEVEQILSRALSEELLGRKRFTLVNEAAQADGVLSGKVLGFDTAPLTFNERGLATEYQITITASMSFRDRAADEVLWENDRYIYKESYQVVPEEAISSEQQYFDQEKLAIEQAAGRFARTVVIDLLEGF